MPREHAWVMLTLTVLAGSCGERTTGSNMWAPLGSTPVERATAGAAEVMCQKAADCGLFQPRQDVQRVDSVDVPAPVSYVVTAIELAQQTSGSVLDSCIAELERTFEVVESRGVIVPWDGMATCVAGAPCVLLKSKDGFMQLLSLCASQLGISAGLNTSGPEPQPPPPEPVTVPPVRQDSGVIEADAAVQQFPDFGIADAS